MSNAKAFLSVSLATLLLAPAFAGERAGLARSEGSYNILRGEKTLPARVSTLNEVETGDFIKSAESLVSVSLANGDAVLVGMNSNVTFPDASTVAIKEGSVAVASEEGLKGKIAFNDLVVTALENDKAQIAGITSDPLGNLMVEVLQGAMAIKNTTTGNQLAVVTPGAGMIVVKDANMAEGYKVVPKDAGQGRLPGNEQSTGQLTPDDRKIAGAWWAGGGANTGLIAAGAVVGAAALGAGGYLIYDEGYRERIRDDDEDDDQDREEISVIEGNNDTPPVIEAVE
ncbi:MAG: hypothetical protein RLY93_08010 [Sumerlaeia bacterium]